MTRLLMLVEGQSEEIFVNRVLKPYLERIGVYIEGPIILWTKRLAGGGGFRGGVSSWSQIRKQLLALSNDGDAWVTSLLDFYGLPSDVPGFDESLGAGSPQERAVALQGRIADEIGNRRFIPFLTLHELEALVFSAPDIVANHFDKPHLSILISNVNQDCGGPELVNHGPDTHPKARLKAWVQTYKETSDGPTLLEKIGIDEIRDACPHFSAWLGKLEALAEER